MRLLKWRTWPLTIQLTVMMATLVAISAIGITLFSVSQQRLAFHNEFEKQAEAILATLETAIINPLYTLNTRYLETTLEALGETETGVQGQIYDPDGRLIANSTIEDALTFDFDADPFGIILVSSDETQFTWKEDHLLAGKAVRAGNQVLGGISIHLSTASLHAQMKSTTERGVAAAVLFVSLGVGAVLFISRTITLPLRSMMGATQRIAEGDLSQRVAIKSGGELIALADAFNHMTVQLQANIKQLEQRTEELNQSNAELGTMNQALEVARNEALAAQEIAQENSRLKSEFLSTMSHELRTPLNAIEGFTSIMLSGMGIELSAQAENMVQRISSNSKRLLDLINDFLDLSRIESGRLELVKEPVSPAQLAEKWRSEVGVLAEEKGIAFIVNVKPELPDILFSDVDALSKIVINLLSNAFKFTHSGQVSLNLSRANDEWEIAVTDTGIGIPPHAREYIFDEFRQVDGSSKREYGGTGLGLALVQKLSRALGGNVVLESEVGVGSTFSVTLPLIVPEVTLEQGVTA